MATAIEINCETGETTERELTAKEVADMEAAAKVAADAKAAEEQAEAEAKTVAEAKLAKLGLTAEDLKALL
jgi:uncharacterized protein (DUF4415 family)